MAIDIEKLTAPFPESAIKHREIGAGLNAAYVDGATVIARLNEATENDWNFAVDRYWVEGHLSYALCTLTIPGLGSRQHIGVQRIDDRSGEDAAAKGAITDALKKAATLFGVGRELYGPDHEPRRDPVPPDRTTISPSIRPVPNQAYGSPIPPSKKQIDLIRKIAGERNVDADDEAMALFGVAVHDLTGGREGTASTLIDHLQSLGR